MPTYTGTNGDNTINGSNGDDTINGLGGEDTLNGGNGNDTINGGADDDVIDGGNGNDNVDGGTGDDSIDGGNGNDVLAGGDDDDTIHGGNGNDVILGGGGNDNLVGDNGDDDFTGGAGDDIIDGNNGFDVARYSGPIGEYSFFSSGGYLHVVHLGGAGADGHDQVKRVERLIFADRVIDIGDGDNLPVAVDDHVFINEDTGTYSSGAASVKDNDFDFDGDTLTVTPGVFVGTYGTLTLNANGTYSYTLNASAQGLDDGENVTDSFNYTVSDNDGSDTGTLVFHIAGLNDAPVANDDTAATTENAAVSGNVLANDTDVDVETLTVANPGTYLGAYGTLVLAANGSYTYTPGGAAQALDDGEVVSDSFSYTASDGTASDTATLTVTVNGVNDAPVANDDTASTTEEASVSGNVLVNDTDVDVEPLTVANPGTYVGTYGTLMLAADGSYTYAPNAAAQGLDTGEVGQDVFTYTASDGTASDMATLTVNVAGLNDAPVANDDAAATTENAAVSGNVLANDTDVDVETLTVANPGTYLGAYGTLVLAANGSYTYTPGGAAQALGDGQVVDDVFNYVASDGTASDSATLTITVTGLGSVPHANDDTASTTEDAAVSGNVLTNDTDDELDPLTVSNPGTYVGTYGTLTLAANGSYTYTPNAAADGLAAGETAQDVFTYTATDGSGSDMATLTVTINGTNDAPTIDAGGTDADGSVTELPDGDPNENVTVHSDSGAVAFDDLDLSDTHSASFTPQGGGYLGTFTLDPVDQPGDSVGWDFTVSDAALEGLSEGQVVTQDYTIQIDDGHGGTVTQDVTITINGTGVGTGPQTVWYIDNSAVGSTNVGTQANPYTSIAAFNAAQNNVGGPQVGHTVHLLAGTGTGVYAEADGINLLNGQILIGDANGAVRPTIEAAAGDGINVAQNNDISGLDIGNTSGADIADSGGSVGTLTISDVGTSGTGQIIDVDQGGTLNVTLNGAESLASSGGAIDLAGVGGSFTVTGATNIAGLHSGGGIDITGSSVAASLAGGGTVATLTTTAVNYVGNTGSLSIGGGFDIVTTSGAGLNASGGGTISATGSGNSITSTNATALNVNGTTIGAAGLTFHDISSGNNDAGADPVNGIVLNNTGASGGLSVTGDGGGANNGSGGTIQHTTGDGILLTNTMDVHLAYMDITGNLGDGIGGSGINGFVLNRLNVTQNGDDAASDESGINITQLTGTAGAGLHPTSISNSVFTNNEEFQVQITNSSGTLTDFQFTNNSVTSDGSSGTIGNLVNFLGLGTAVMTINATGGTYTGNAPLSATALNIDHSGSGGSMTASVNGGTFVNNNVAISASVANGADLDVDVQNTISNGNRSHALNLFLAANATGQVTGSFVNNSIGTLGVTGSGSALGIGIRIQNESASTLNPLTVLISANTIREIASSSAINVFQGIVGQTSSRTTNVTITDNIISDIDNNRAIIVQQNNNTNATSAGILNLDIHGNNFDLASIAGSAGDGTVIRIREFTANGGDVNITQTQATAAAVASELDDANGFNNPARISVAGSVDYGQPAPPLPMMVAPGAAPAGDGGGFILGQSDLDRLIEAAIQRWADSGATVEQIATMRAVSFTVSALAGHDAARSESGLIRLDDDGGGFGWFVDATPGEDSEFDGSGSAIAGGAAEGRIDALTVILHELGHQIGLDDDYHGGGEAELMYGYVNPGERRLPDGVFEEEPALIQAAGADWGDMPLTYPDCPTL